MVMWDIRIWGGGCEKKEAMVQKGKYYHCTLFDKVKKESMKSLEGDIITMGLTEEERERMNLECSDNVEWIHTEDYECMKRE